MARKIAICTHKGGTGKTVTAISLSAGLANAGHRTLLIDLDPQGHSTIGLGVDVSGRTIKDFFEHHPTQPLRDVIQPTAASDKLDIAPSDLRLAWVAEGLSGRPKHEELLRRGMRQADTEYDWIVIDTPPSLGMLTQNAVSAADYILIPTLAEARAANAIVDLLELVQVLRGEDFTSYGVLLTRLDARKTRTNPTVMAMLEPWSGKILKTTIPQSEPLNQAQLAQTDIFRFDASSPGAAGYQRLIEELISL